MRFEWDPKKERLNVAKHNVSFREAKELFTSKVYTEHREDTVRIISARWAIEKERALYLECMEKRS